MWLTQGYEDNISSLTIGFAQCTTQAQLAFRDRSIQLQSGVRRGQGQISANVRREPDIPTRAVSRRCIAPGLVHSVFCGFRAAG